MIDWSKSADTRLYLQKNKTVAREKNGIPFRFEEDAAEGEGNEDPAVVSIDCNCPGHRYSSQLSSRGLDNAGKTTILKRFNGESIDTISPTLGFNIKTLEHRGYTLNMWDVGGQKSLRSYWRNYFECTDGLVWVVDSADRMRLESCREELMVLLKEERLAGATLLVLANKQDLPGALSAQEIKDVSGFLNLKSYKSLCPNCDSFSRKILELDNIKTHHWSVVGVSAVTGDKLLNAVDWLLDDIAKRIFTLD